MAGTPGTDHVESGRLEVLLDHLVGGHHDLVRSELPRLEQLLELVVRAGDPRGPAVRGLFADFAAAACSHLFNEETVVFVAFRELAQAPLASPGLERAVALLVQEHARMMAMLAQLRALAAALVPAPEAGAAHAELVRGLAGLVAGIGEHIRLEETLLFPWALARTRG